MAATQTQRAHRTWPIAYGHRRRVSRGIGTGMAWALFLGLGLPFALMAALTTLARTGIYVDLLRPLWQPWPPDLVKPFLGIAVFAATLAFLAYRVGHRSGFRAGIVNRMASARNAASVGDRLSPSGTNAPAELPPPPPPADPLA